MSSGAPAAAYAQTGKSSDGSPEMGSFDELITPFLMDSSENFDFDDNGPVSSSSHADVTQFSFDGLGMVEDLFTQSNLDYLSEHSLGAPSRRDSFQIQSVDSFDLSGLNRKRTRNDNSANTRGEGLSTERRKQMYIDYLKEYVGNGEGEEVEEAKADQQQQQRKKTKTTRASVAAKKKAAEEEAAASAAATTSKRKRGGGRRQAKSNNAASVSRAGAVPPSSAVSKEEEEEENGEDTASLQRAIMLQFLKYRTSNVIDMDRWSDLLDEKFELVMPREPYRVSHGIHAARNSLVVSGIEGIVRDTRSVTALVEMIRARCWRIKQLDLRARLANQTNLIKQDMEKKAGGASNEAEAAEEAAAAAQRRLQAAAIAEQAPKAASFAKIGMRYVADAREMIVGDRLLMSSWTLETVGLVEVGFASEVAIDGMLKAKFTQDGARKLEKLSLSFDCMAFMQQLNTQGLLDMAAIAAAASAASRNATNIAAAQRSAAATSSAATTANAAAASVRQAAANPQQLQQPNPAAILNNPSVLAGLAAASPAFASALAAASRATPSDVATRARLLLNSFQAAQKAAAGNTNGNSTSPASLRPPTDASTSEAQRRDSTNTTQHVPGAPVSGSTTPPLGTNSADLARSAAASQQYLRAFAAASNNAGVANVVRQTGSAAAGGGIAQKTPQQQQQMLAQCMPYLANYSWNLALARQQQSKVAANAQGLTPAQQQQQQAHIQRYQQQAQQQLQQQLLQQQLAQQQKAQLANQQTLAQHHHQQQQYAAAHPQYAQRQQQLAQAQLTVQGQSKQPATPDQKVPVTGDASISNSEQPQAHPLQSGGQQIAQVAAPASTIYPQHLQATSSESIAVGTASSLTNASDLASTAPQPGMQMPTTAPPTTAAANALLAKYVASGGSTPMMQMMANYMANLTSHQQRQQQQQTDSTTSHVPAQPSRQ